MMLHNYLPKNIMKGVTYRRGGGGAIQSRCQHKPDEAVMWFIDQADNVKLSRGEHSAELS